MREKPDETGSFLRISQERPRAREERMTATHPRPPRAAAIVGPYLSGKTALLESLLAHAGAVKRKGSAKDGNTVGDSSEEARRRTMSTELNIATTQYLDEDWTFLDCPGSVELMQETLCALSVCDAAVICCEPEPDKALTVAHMLRFLDDNDIPHILFVNKMDQTEASVRQTMAALQSVSARPLVLREIPIREGGKVTGHVDLVSERAFRWQEGKPSELIEMPEAVRDEEVLARQEMLESLADFDDDLLEQLLEDKTPATEEIYEHLTRTLDDNKLVPVFFGSAEHDNGIRRLLKALRHEAPGPEETAARLGVDTSGICARVFKTLHAGHAGKLSIARIWSGGLKDGHTFQQGRVGGIGRMFGQKTEKVGEAKAGEIVALGRMDDVGTGAVLSDPPGAEGGIFAETLPALFALAIHPKDRADEVKLMTALSKLTDEDPALAVEHDQNTGELLLRGQGEVHLSIACDRLRSRFGIEVVAERPQTPYKETIRKPITKRSRHKKQSGGHGEFGDVALDIKPLPRGSGFSFEEKISGGVVPKQYFPAVEAGVKEFMQRGPLGFPVIDVSVTLTDGQYHSVDSSEMAFKKAAAQCMREAVPEAQPVLLEPICEVTLAVPNAYTSKIQRLVSGRRGQIMGFDAKPGWDGWDEIKVQLPQAEMHDLIIELRSLTMGVGTYSWKFDHLQELSGKEAEQVVAARGQAAQ